MVLALKKVVVKLWTIYRQQLIHILFCFILLFDFHCQI